MRLRFYEVHVLVFVDPTCVDHTDEAAGHGKRSHLAAGHPPGQTRGDAHLT